MRFYPQRAFAVTLRYLYLLRGSLSRVLPIFAWVTIDMILWGFITRYLGTVSQPGLHLSTALLSAVICWGFFGRAMHGVSMAFFEDVWSRNFLNVFSSPVSIAEYLAGLTLSSILTSALALGILLLASTWLFDLSLLQHGPVLALLLFTLFLFGIALGIIGCAAVLRLGPPAEWFIWPVPAVIAPFVGVFYPLETLPGWMQVVAHALPPSYVFEHLRALINLQPLPVTAALPGLGLGLCWLFLAGLLFSHIFKHAIRSGLLARYSAEHIT